MALFAKAKPVIGVDVGSSSVKVIQLKSTGNGYALERIGIAPIRMDVSRGAKQEIPESIIADAVSAAIADSGASSKDICCSVAGESVIVRYLQFPDMNDAEVDYAIRLQAEEYIPFRLDEVNLDYQRLDTPIIEGGKRVDLLLVAVRKNLVNRRVDVLKSIGLNPVVMDVDTFALLNCFEVNYDFRPDEVVALVSIGASITNINIFSNGISRFARDIALAGNSITDAVSSKMGLTFNEAEKIKITRGNITLKNTATGEPAEEEESNKDTVKKTAGEKTTEQDSKTKISGIIRQPVQNLINEIRRSLQFFENQPNGKPISRILLTGGGALLVNLDRFIEERLGVPVEMADPLRKLDVSMITQEKHNLKDLAPMLAVGIGLGLRKLGDKQ